MRGFLCLIALVLLSVAALPAQDRAALPLVKDVEQQPLAAQVQRVAEALDFLGVPLAQADRAALEAATKEMDAARSVEAIQKVLDPYCLVGVELKSDKEMTAAAGPAKAELTEQGWTQFLVKIHNPQGLTGELRAASPSALRLHNSLADQVASRWLDLQMFNQQPLLPKLSGLALEYRIIQLYSRDSGPRTADLSMEYVVRGGRPANAPIRDFAPKGDPEVVIRTTPVQLSCDCAASHEVTFRVLDEKGQPTTAAFLVRDPQNRVYPSQAKRLAPDFAFHPQIYRGDGEKLKLPAGTYTIMCLRGPESIPETKMLTVRTGRPRLAIRSSGGSIRRSSAGIRATITFTRPAARITPIRQKAFTPRT